MPMGLKPPSSACLYFEFAAGDCLFSMFRPDDINSMTLKQKVKTTSFRVKINPID